MVKRFVDHEAHLWHQRLYGLLVTCQDLGKLNKAVHKEERKADQKDAKPGGGTEAKREAVKIRKFNKDPVWHAFVMYANVENLYRQQLIVVCTDALHK